MFFDKFIRNRIKDNIIFLHYRLTNNIGDLYCSPQLYFKEFRDYSVEEISDVKHRSYKNKILIIGGGGLLQEHFCSSIQHIMSLKETNHIVFWGLGLDNTPEGKIFDTEIIQNADLIGVRDYNTQYQYVPCVSCMSKLFDKYRKKKPKKKIRCYLHAEYDFPNDISNCYESLFNTQQKNDKNAFKRAIEFLSDSEYIITNSFHGAYWATLLNRKVIAVPYIRNGNIKFSDKFLTLKYKPVYVNEPYNLEYNLKECLKKAQNYEQALDDSRKINIEFFENVKKHFL